jgi:hypothetical protein
MHAFDASLPWLCRDFSIVDLAGGIEKAAYLYRRTDQCLESKGPAVMQQLRDYLRLRFGEGIPSLDELQEWVQSTVQSARKNRFTTSGIVVRIVHQARLFGARGAFTKTLRRVDRVLARAAIANQRSREGAEVPGAHPLLEDGAWRLLSVVKFPPGSSRGSEGFEWSLNRPSRVSKRRQM